MTAPRIVFYCHDTFGLGHFRRTLNIANQLRRRIPDCSVLIMTGLDSAAAFEAAPGVDFVKLPAVKKVGPDEYRSRHLKLSFRSVQRLRENLIRTITRSFKPDLFIVDNVPRGVGGELLSTLDWLRRKRPDTRIVLTLRDILDDPETIVPQWREQGVYDLLADTYDELWVAAWRDLIDPTALYAFPPAVKRKTRLCGFIARRSSSDAAALIGEELGFNGYPLVVVGVGGGGDGYPLLDAYANALDRLHTEVRSAIFLGPDLPAVERHDLKRRLLPRSARVAVFDFRPDFVDFLPLAALTISMAGYNTTAEILAHRNRAVLVPRVFPRREQWLRAKLLADQGLVRLVEPEGLGGAQLAAVIDDALAQPPPVPQPVDFGGLRRIAKRARRLLGLPEDEEA